MLHSYLCTIGAVWHREANYNLNSASFLSTCQVISLTTYLLPLVMVGLNSIPLDVAA